MIHSHLTLGQFSTFYLYLNMLIAPMRSLGVMLGLAQRATASGARIFQVLDREPRIIEAPDAPPLPTGAGHVEFRGVSLRYDDVDDFGATYTAPGERTMSVEHSNGSPRAKRAVLSDIDLDVAAGSTVALVGATGSGKTSLVSLISRLYEASAGQVLLDGTDIRTVSLSSLRQAVAVVSDDPFLFSASVAENIAYGRPSASLEEIEQAARRAQAYEFVMNLPQGFDTRVGERGLSLSGGQRQRIAIGRAHV